MSHCVMIPCDAERAVSRTYLESFADYGLAVGGYVEAVVLPTPELVLLADEDGKQKRLPINYRATWLFWLFRPECYRVDFLVGDVVLAGWPRFTSVWTDVPEEFVDLLLNATSVKLQARSVATSDQWLSINGVFSDYFEAASIGVNLLHHFESVEDVRIVPA